MSPYYSVGAIAKACGLSPHTIRAWEKRYGLIEPRRTEAGDRVYTEEDLGKLRLFAELTSAGHQIGKLSRLSVEELRELLKRSRQVHPRNEDTRVQAQKFSVQILGALKEYDIKEVSETLIKARLTMGTKDFLLSFCSPLFHELGQLTQSQDFCVAQEHLVSALVRDQILKIQMPAPRFERRIAFATRDGDYHEFGILIANFLFRIYGYDTYYFGPNLPADALADAVKGLRLSSLVLGSVPTSPPGELEKEIQLYLSSLDAKLEGGFSVYVGGVESAGNLLSRAAPYSNLVVRVIPTLFELNELIETGQI